MNKVTLKDSNHNVEVRESSLINYVFSFVLLTIVVCVFITRNYEKERQVASLLIYIPLLVTSVILFVNGYRRAIIMVINEKGLFYKDKLIVNWHNIRNAHLQLPEPGETEDSNITTEKCFIVIRYYDPVLKSDFIIKLPMSNSQDKSCYQILSAVQHFSGIQKRFDTD